MPSQLFIRVEHYRGAFRGETVLVSVDRHRSDARILEIDVEREFVATFGEERDDERTWRKGRENYNSNLITVLMVNTHESTSWLKSSIDQLAAKMRPPAELENTYERLCTAKHYDFKKGQVLDPANYRPISLLTSSEKILQQLILHRIMGASNARSPIKEALRKGQYTYQRSKGGSRIS